jgi:hypothetical protein
MLIRPAHRYPVCGLGLESDLGDTLCLPTQSKKGPLCK